MKLFDSGSSRLLSLSTFIIIFPYGFSLHVVPGSNCTALCSFQDLSSNTTIDEITCQDKSYDNTAMGKTFKDCVTCEFESKSFDHGTGQTDLGWALYNIRFASNWCLFGGRASTDAACDQACQRTKSSLELSSGNSTTLTPYGYCEDLDAVAFTNCAMCYAQVSDHDYISNFLRVLGSACEWKITPPMGFPIKGSQVFTYKAPSNYSTLGPDSFTHRSSFSGLSYQSKLAIGIAIPTILFLILCSIVLLFWYLKLHLPGGKSLHHRQSFEAEPEFQLYEKRRGEKGGVAYPPLSPDSPWHSNMTPTIYHPTPALALQHTNTTRHHHAASPPPAHLRLHATTSTTTTVSPRLSQHHQQQAQYHPPPTTTKSRPRPNIKIETGAIMAAAPSVPSTTSPSPPRQFSRKTSPPLSSYHPAIGTRLAREEQEGEMEMGRYGRGMEGSSRRDMDMEMQWGRIEDREGTTTTTKRGKFHFPTLGGMLGRTTGKKEKEREKKTKKGTKSSNRRKKDAAGSEDLFS